MLLVVGSKSAESPLEPDEALLSQLFIAEEIPDHDQQQGEFRKSL